MKQTYRIYNDFSKGLNTDFNSVNQDPDSLLRINNFVINNNGTVSKRKGLNQISNIPTGIILPKKNKSKVVNTYTWKNVLNSIKDIVVVQYGEMLYFYYDGKDLAANKLGTVIDLKDFFTSKRLFLEDIKLTFTEIKGRLVASHSQLTPFYIDYKDGDIKTNKININVRDYFGKDDILKLEERPEVLTLEHMYNLYNQGWDAWAIYSCYYINGYFPSNKDVLNNLYDSNLQNRQSMENAFNTAINNNELPLYPLSTDELADMNKLYEDTKKYFQGEGSGVKDSLYYETSGSYGVELVDFKKMNNNRNLFKASKGRVIKDLFSSNDLNNIVERPVVEDEDKPIDKNKWNDFHFAEEIHDIFFDGKNVKLVLTLDKEHGLVGGHKESIECLVDGIFGYHEEIENQKTLNSPDTRIYNYDFSDVFLKYIGTDRTPIVYEVPEGLWVDPSPTSYPGKKFKRWYEYETTDDTPFDYKTTNNTDFIIRNATTDPHKYKCAYLTTEVVGDDLFDYRSTLNTKMFREIGNHTIETIRIIKGNGGELFVSYPDGSWIQGNNYYGDTDLDNNRGKPNSIGTVLFSSNDAFNNMPCDSTQFDKQKIKAFNPSTEPNKKIKLEKAECYIEALSRHKCVLNIPLKYFNDRPDEWLFNTDVYGSLIGYNNIINNLKIKFSSSLYLKMKSIYENKKRDEYASKKLDEEFKDNDKFMGVKRISLSSNRIIQEESSVTENMETGFILELDKEHKQYNNRSYTANFNPIKPNSINLLYGDFTETNNLNIINKKCIAPRITRPYNVSISNNPKDPSWGKYLTDYTFSLRLKTGTAVRNIKDMPIRYRDLINNKACYYSLSIKLPINLQSKYIYNYGEGLKSNLHINSIYFTGKEERFYSSVKPDFKYTWGESTVNYMGRYNDEVEETFKDDGISNSGSWKKNSYAQHGSIRSSTIDKNLTTTGTPEDLYMTALFLGREGYNPSDCSFDFCEQIMYKPILNTTIEKRKSFNVGKNDVFYFGGKYINIMFDNNNLFTYDNFEGTIKKEDTDKYYPFVFDLIGRQLNLEEIMNMKFCTDNSISPDEILKKQRAYRSEWNWDLDGLTDFELINYKHNVKNKIEITKPDIIKKDDIKFSKVSEQFRPNSSVAFSGRVFYGGINCNKYGNSVFYSRIITENIKDEIGKCYTVNDPSSKYSNNTLATDGGYINIDNAGIILGLKVVGSVLCVVCSNGIWGISGGNGYFQADNQTVKKISNVGCISPHSIEVVDNTLIYCSEYSINALILNSVNSDLIPNDITKNRINKLYESIPLSSKENIKSIYDKLKGIIYYLYSDKEHDNLNPSYNKIIIYNMIKNSFFTFSIDEKNWKVKDGMINEYVYDDMRLKLVCSNEEDISFFDFIDDSYIDFTNTDYTAELNTTNQIVVSPSNKLIGGDLTTHFLNTDNSSCRVLAKYDYNHTNKNSKEVEVYKETPREIIYNRVMLVGEGNSLNLNYTSDSGKACDILGFEIKYNVVEK